MAESQPPAKPKTPLVFVSYCRDDYDRVLQLRNALSSYQIVTWIDSNIAGGERWEHEIQKAIEASAFYLLCLSQAVGSRKETYVATELNLIFKKERNENSASGIILPVLLDCDRFLAIAGFNYHEEQSRIQHVSLAQNWSAGVAKLLSSIDPTSGRVAELTNELDASSARRRIYAARQLGDLGHLSLPALPYLRRLLTDADETVQANAAVAIGSIGDASNETIAALVTGLKCSQIDWGYGYPVFLSTIRKLMQANPALLPALKSHLDEAMRDETNEKVRQKLSMAAFSISAWAKEEDRSERTSSETPCDQLSFALSNSDFGLMLEIERPHGDELLVRWSGDTHDTELMIAWSHYTLSFSLYDLARGPSQVFAKTSDVRDAVSATRRFFAG
jgi:hypothetical protein